MSPVAWSFEHSVECAVPIQFAWEFWTDVRNWKLNGDVERVELSGPFAEGSSGTTFTRSTGPIHWRVVLVQAEREAVLEASAPGGKVHFRWTFEDLGERTRMTQRASISEESAAIASAAAAIFEPGIPAGMQKMCEAMKRAFASD
ncbi:MAG: SRPBCC family protein [Acidobacteriaceae bacterium]|nr:SRPBCC family protein [Acidobacteriaceae bacterium]